MVQNGDAYVSDARDAETEALQQLQEIDTQLSAVISAIRRKEQETQEPSQQQPNA